MTKPFFRSTLFLLIYLTLPVAATAQTEVVISAETIRNFGKTSSENIAFVRDADASNGLAFQFIGGANNPLVANPTAWWEVEFWCEAGTYYIWARGKSDGDTGTEAFWLQFDDQISTTDHTADPEFMGRGLGNWREMFDAGIYGWASQGVPPLKVVMWTTNRTGLHRIRAQPRQTPHYLDQLLISQHQNQQPGNTAWPTEFPRRDPVPAQGKRVTLPDPNLRAAVETALGKAAGDTITVADMETLIALHERPNISDLTGLEHATNLTRLVLWDNNITDISPLAGLTNLTWLDLSINNISDISPLAGLTNLTWLNLSINNISDISPLAGLVNLTEIKLDRNPIADTSPLCTLVRQSPGLKLDIAVGGCGGDIPDPYLLAAIEKALGKGAGDTITADEMETLTELNAPRAGITDLTGIEFATNLTTLNLSFNDIADLSPISALTGLRELYFTDSHTSDVSPFVNLTNLKILELGGAHDISDISPLAGLTNLTRLSVWRHGTQGDLSDISVVANFPRLTYLSLGTHHISDISALAGLTNLTRLHLDINNVSDLSPLAGLTNLTWLGLSINNISDISPLAGLTNLTWLGLYNNNISDISALAGLVNLTEIRLDRNPIADTSPLCTLLRQSPGLKLDIEIEGCGVDIPDSNLRAAIEKALGKGAGAVITADEMATLTEFNVSGTKGITDFTGLETAGNLEVLNISHLGVQKKNLSPISGLTGLRELYFTDSRISDVSPLAGLTNLSVLDLGGVQDISDISPLSKLTNLTKLDLWHLGKGDLSDISVIANFSNLTVLSLRNHHISDISALAGLTNLTSLDLTVNNISDISPLAGLTNLKELKLEVNPIEDTAVLCPLIEQNTDLKVDIEIDCELAVSADTDLIHLALGAVKATALLQNYPNPFNPETWIPYLLADDAFVTLTIHDESGRLVRSFDVGHQRAGVYESRSKAVYWDGRNDNGEPVVSGVYFYQLNANDYSATRRMVILK